jgi:hypothetical protein
MRTARWLYAKRVDKGFDEDIADDQQKNPHLRRQSQDPV